MVNISKRHIQTKDYKIAHEQLHSLVASLNNKTADYLTDLYTDAEKIMLTKRFAAVFMYSQGYSPYRTSHTLGLSLSTCQRLFELYENGNYSRLLSCIEKKETNKFLELIEDLIMSQVSPRAKARLLKRVL